MILMWDETISDSDETTIFYAISWFLTESSRSSFNYLSFFTKGYECFNRSSQNKSNH
jgi:hypothetical protein